MIEFMENGRGDYKTSIAKNNIPSVREQLQNLGFTKETDFHIADYMESEEIIFYNKKCKKAYEVLMK